MKLLPWDSLKEKGHPYTRRHTERMVKEGRFPAPIHVGDRGVAWIEAEIDAHYAARAALRNHPKDAA